MPGNSCSQHLSLFGVRQRHLAPIASSDSRILQDGYLACNALTQIRVKIPVGPLRVSGSKATIRASFSAVQVAADEALGPRVP